jgi:tripartite-type tricarboxylate transporter receptor subunit TctC
VALAQQCRSIRIGKEEAVHRSVALALAGVVSVLALLGSPAQAAYPDRPITVVVPASPGGGSDFVGRLFADHLRQATGQPVPVEYVPGAGQTIGYANVARSSPDGYRILITDSSQTGYPALYNLPFDPLVDIEPVTLLYEVPVAIIASGALKAANLAELIALAKASPGALNYGSGGIGTANHVAGEVFANVAGIELFHVPYKGAGPAMAALLGEGIQLMFASMTTGGIAANHEAAKIRVLAVSGDKRVPGVSNVPSAAEAGVPQYDYKFWWGIAVPRGTPANVVERLNAQARAFLQKPETQQKLAPISAQILGTSAAEARQGSQERPRSGSISSTG